MDRTDVHAPAMPGTSQRAKVENVGFHQPLLQLNQTGLRVPPISRAKMEAKPIICQQAPVPIVVVQLKMNAKILKLAEHARTVTIRLNRNALVMEEHGQQLLGMRIRMEKDACVIVHREITAAQHAKMYAIIWIVYMGRRL
jgi:hypothetical protein